MDPLLGGMGSIQPAVSDIHTGIYSISYCGIHLLQVMLGGRHLLALQLSMVNNNYNSMYMCKTVTYIGSDTVLLVYVIFYALFYNSSLSAYKPVKQIIVLFILCTVK